MRVLLIVTMFLAVATAQVPTGIEDPEKPSKIFVDIGWDANPEEENITIYQIYEAIGPIAESAGVAVSVNVTPPAELLVVALDENGLKSIASKLHIPIIRGKKPKLSIMESPDNEQWEEVVSFRPELRRKKYYRLEISVD